jgi:hypothetical protein
MGPTQLFVRRGGEEVHVSVLERSCDLVVNQIAVLKKMALVDGGRKLVRNFELQITPRPLVTSQEFETFGKRAVGGQEVVDAVDLDMEYVLEVCAFGNDAANPVTGPLDCTQFYSREVRKDEDEQLGWKAEERPRTGLERHTVLP